MKYRWAGQSDIGLMRDRNEDAVHPGNTGESEGSMVAVIADGMGGHVAGEIASQLAVAAALEHEGSVAERIEAANTVIIRRTEADPDLAGMGTTLTIAVFEADSLTIGHVGDSRAYLLRDGSLEALTEDHTVVAEMVASGRLSDTEAATHPYRNLLTRGVGLEPDIEVDSLTVAVEPGDRFLLCSDGLSGLVDDEHIAQILGEKAQPEEAAGFLIEAAKSAGGHDNISVVVVHAVE